MERGIRIDTSHNYYLEEIAKLKMENAKLILALEYYADERNWGDGGEIDSEDHEDFFQEHEDFDESLIKGGKLARETLEKIKEL